MTASACQKACFQFTDTACGGSIETIPRRVPGVPRDILVDGPHNTVLVATRLRKDKLLLLKDFCPGLDVCPLTRSDELADTYGEGEHG
jgi:hypothetical protein